MVSSVADTPSWSWRVESAILSHPPECQYSACSTSARSRTWLQPSPLSLLDQPHFPGYWIAHISIKTCYYFPFSWYIFPFISLLPLQQKCQNCFKSSPARHLSLSVTEPGLAKVTGAFHVAAASGHTHCPRTWTQRTALQDIFLPWLPDHTFSVVLHLTGGSFSAVFSLFMLECPQPES